MIPAPGEGHEGVAGAVGLVVVVERIVPPRAVLLLPVKNDFRETRGVGVSSKESVVFPS